MRQERRRGGGPAEPSALECPWPPDTPCLDGLCGHAGWGGRIPAWCCVPATPRLSMVTTSEFVNHRSGLLRAAAALRSVTAASALTSHRLRTHLAAQRDSARHVGVGAPTEGPEALVSYSSRSPAEQGPRM